MGKTIIALIAIIIVGSVIGLILLVPGLSNSIITFITGQSVACSEAPYNPNCECTIDREKVQEGFRYVCVTHSPEATTDCDWCAGQCLEWKKVWEEYPSSEEYNTYCAPRTPVPGYACVARQTAYGNLECAAVPSIPTEGLIVFCTNEALVEFIQNWQGTNEELVGWFRGACPVPGKDPYNNCDLEFAGDSEGTAPEGKTISLIECRSTCYDTEGKATGGHIVWYASWHNEDRNNIINVISKGYTSDCISGI